jgi:hypothetical protein
MGAIFSVVISGKPAVSAVVLHSCALGEFPDVVQEGGESDLINAGLCGHDGLYLFWSCHDPVMGEGEAPGETREGVTGSRRKNAGGLTREH